MKKLLAAFGIGISIIFAGFSFAEKETLCVQEWNKEYIDSEKNPDYKPNLYSACTDAEKAETSAVKWMKKYIDFKIETSDKYFNELKSIEDAGKESIKVKQEEFYELEDELAEEIDGILTNISEKEQLVAEKRSNLNIAMGYVSATNDETGLYQFFLGLAEDAENELEEAEIELANAINERDELLDGLAEAESEIREAEQKAKDDIQKKINERFEKINNKIESGNLKAERVFFKGFKIVVEISDDLADENQNKGAYSDLELESLFMEATTFFQNAEKLARKPVIHSGGILPGPGDEEDGTNYFVNGFLTKFVNESVVLLFSIGTLIFIIGGLMFLFSSGDEEMKTKAKDTIFWGIVGVVIAVLSYALVKFVVGLDFGF